MNKTINTCCLMLVSIALSAQGVFEPGYVITNKGDSISGLVALQSDDDFYRQCHFKNENVDEVYSPTDLRAYGFLSGRKYTSGIVENSFVSELVSGTANLYQFEEKLFVSNQRFQGRLVTINTEKVKVLMDGKSMMVQDAKWKGFLNAILSDCSEINVEKLVPGAAPIGDAIVKYNQCIGSAYTDYRTYYNPKLRSGLFVSAGVVFNNVKVVEQNYNDDRLDNFNNIGFRIGVAYETYPFRLSPKLGLGISLDYSAVNMERTFDLPNSGSVERKHEYLLEQRSLALSILMKRDLLVNGNTKVTLFGGPFINYSGQSDYYANSISRDTNTNEVSSSLRYSLKLNTLVGGGIVGVSAMKEIKTHTFGLKVDYTFNGKMDLTLDNFVYLRSRVTQFGVSLVYGLK